MGVEYDHNKRRFSGSILWEEGPLAHNSYDTYKWTLEMKFSSDLHQTIGFKETQFNRDGRVLKTFSGAQASRLRLYGILRD